MDNDAQKFGNLSYLNDDDPLQNVSVGSISNYVAVFCDATQFSDQVFDINNLTGYKPLAIRCDANFAGL
jgi:hypothetical protein